VEFANRCKVLLVVREASHEHGRILAQQFCLVRTDVDQRGNQRFKLDQVHGERTRERRDRRTAVDQEG